MGVLPVEDYIRRPIELEQFSLYEWMTRCEQSPNSGLPKSYAKGNDDCETDVSEDTLMDWDDSCSDASSSNQSHEDLHDRASVDEMDMMPDSQQTLVDDDNTRRKMKSSPPHRTRHTKLQHYPFLEDHPLSDSHHVVCRPESDRHIPNFVGGMLPHSDVRDRDFYCLTMLALFVPWRNRRTLKKDQETWIDTFDSRVFMPWQLWVMKHFNLRYECLDARDDYHAQMTKDTAKEMHPMFSMDETGDVIMEFDKDGNELMTADYGINMEDHDNVIHGEAFRCKMLKAAKIQRIMGSKGCNWTMPVEALADMRHISPVEITDCHTSSHWKETITSLRQGILDKRQASNKGGLRTSIKFSKCYVNQTEILTRSHLTKRAKHQSDLHENRMQSVSAEFSLNAEQERAYNIIVQHAQSAIPEQLRMYIGGMGGTGKTQVL